LKQRILDPIGAKPGDWVRDASGNPHIPNGAHFTAREWMKYGQWLLQGGEWNGKQIVGKNLLDELVKPSKTNPGHGLAMWLNRPEGQGAHRIHSAPAGVKGGWIYHDGYPDLFAALGAGKCRLYVIPSFDMVVLRQGDSRDDRYVDHHFLSLLLTGKAPEPVPRRWRRGP
jgi:CubicO group peptidase (beta-lactamase class C family)